MKKLISKFNIVLGGLLLIGATFSAIGILRAAAPNPGHNFVEVGGGTVQGDVLYGSAADTLSALAKDANATRYISNTGISNNPAWAQVNLANGVSGNLPVGNLGSGTNAGATTFWRGDGSWSVVTGALLGVQVLTSGTTYTPTSGTNSIIIRLVGGGGGGGGATAAASAVSVAGGGGSASYAEKRFAGIAGAGSYTIAIGAAGAAGLAANGTGGAGGNTTFACPASCTGGALTVTANGGAGGIASGSGTAVVSSLGGAGGAVSTNGDLNTAGQPGGYALRTSGTTGVSGSGGSSLFGGGGNARNAAAAGNSAGNFGSGGSGAASFSATGFAGGSGTPGAMVIWEFR